MKTRDNCGGRLMAAMLAVSSLVLVCTGCAGPSSGAAIPHGKWIGEGVYFSEEWKEGPDQRSKCETYETTLEIRPGRLDDQDVILVELLSKHPESSGPIEGDVHIVAALQQVKCPADDLILYRVVGSLFNPGPNDTLRFDDDNPPYGASSALVDGAVRLVLQYPLSETFVDFIVFRGDEVEKSGVYYTKDEGVIHWFETLHRH